MVFNFRRAIKRIPVISTVCTFVYYRMIEPFRKFQGSEAYWKSRYSQGGNSGGGSYNSLADFKAEVINKLVSRNDIVSVIEFGCGDGNQLALAEYPCYLGVDVSPDAVERCKQRFSSDERKSFLLLNELAQERAELSLSLDVIYHLVEDSVFVEYMQTLFSAATRFVVIYSSNTDTQQNVQGKHIHHRHFSGWVEEHMKEWRLLEHIPNKYPYNGNDDTGSFADFYIYYRVSQ